MYISIWGKKIAHSSTQYARMGRAVEIDERAFVLCGLLVLLVMLSTTASAIDAEQYKPITFDIPQQRADLALTEFAEQANLTLMFPFDEVRKKTANRLVGKYLLEDAIKVLLAGTGFTPTFTNRVVLNIAPDEKTEPEGVEVNATKKAGIGAILAAVFSLGASAQDPDELDKDKSEGATELIVVTGSRLDAVPASSPVLVITREDIDARGLRSVDELLRYIPQNFSSVNVGGAFSGQSAQFGASTVNLRGLGGASTLILIDGKRISTSPGTQSSEADISGIPFAAIERVEVLTDSASAIYGSDAVGGVVNFILKKDYQGINLNVRYENSSSGADRYIFEPTLGASWGSGRVTASLSYQSEDGITDATDVGFRESFDFRDLGGRRFEDRVAGPALSFFGGLPENAPPGSFFALLPPGDGTNIDINDITYVSFLELATQTGNFEAIPTLRSATLGSVWPESKSYSANVVLSQDLSDSLNFNLSGFYSRRDVDRDFGRTALVASVPTSNFYNNFGFPVVAFYRFQNETDSGLLPTISSDFTSERYNAYATLTWDMPFEGWQADISASMGRNSIDSVTRDVMGFFFPTHPPVVDALASSDPNTALNLLGDGSAQLPSFEGLTFDEDEGSSKAKQRVLGINFRGPLFQAPGGDVQLAFGGEVREDKLDFVSSIQTGRFTTDVPSADNVAFYVEAAVPLTNSDTSIPLLKDLGLQLALRYDDYTVNGEFTTGMGREEHSFDALVGKIGISFYPLESLKVRASWSESFQVPELQDLFTSFRSTTTFIVDPLNPDSNGGPGIAVPVNRLSGGNPGLQPQLANTLAIGFDFAPSEIDGLSLSATWSRIEVDDVVSTLGGLFGSNLTFPLENPDVFPTFAVRDAAGVLVSVDQRSLNLDQRRLKAIDFDGRYTFGTGIGEFTAGVLGTYTLELETSLLPGLDPIVLDGTSLGPVNWNVRGFIDWSNGNWGGAATVNHTSGYDLAGDEFAIKTDVDGYTTLNLQASYEIPESGWKITLGANNLFDADFPFVDTLVGIDTTHVDFRRRVVYLNVTKDFSW